MFTAVLAPVDAARLAGPADDLLGTPPAYAQTRGIVDGTPENCAATYGADWAERNEDLTDPATTPDPDDVGSLCVLETLACPDPLVIKLQYRTLNGSHIGTYRLPDGRESMSFDSLTFERALTTFPAFCEAIARDSDPGTHYEDCDLLDEELDVVPPGSLNPVKARLLAWVRVVDLSLQECQMIVPARCPLSDSAQLNRSAGDACLAVQRRTWSCTNINGIDGLDGVQTNHFGKCYLKRGSLSPSDPHAACDGNPPPIPLVSCRDYVGGNFIDSPASQSCPGFTYELAGVLQSFRDFARHPHWCQYNPSHLEADCHDDTTRCRSGSNAYCLKREISGTGCDGIAAALNCRDLQAQYRPVQQAANSAAATRAEAEAAARADRSNVALQQAAAAAAAAAATAASTAAIEAEIVYDAGCVPCVVLPFLGAPENCPQTLRTVLAEPSSNPVDDRHHADTRLHKFDWMNFRNERRCVGNAGAPGCDWTRRCEDPPGGQLAWTSSTSNGMARVGSTLTIRVDDLTVMDTRRYIRASTLGSLAAALSLSTINEMRYADGSVLRTRLLPRNEQAGMQRTSLMDLLGQGECVATAYPRIWIRIEELWPDDNRSDIIELFGLDAVNWWDELPDDDARRSVTEAQGYEYIGVTGGLHPNSSDAELERHERVSRTGEEIPCNLGDDVWCRWEPKRAGYFRLTAEGTWNMAAFRQGLLRRWRPGSNDVRQSIAGITPIGTALQAMLGSDDGDCLGNSATDYDCVIAHLGVLGQPLVDIQQHFADIGIDISFNSMNRLATIQLQPIGLPREWLYSLAADEDIYACPPRDPRATCGVHSPAYNYTESAPIGIAVYEVRTVTRPPSD
ncbi:hypothetical protein [Candidatus Poriferisodalis sp.]|uniref:hypothetical protein n=1 Tax=Candidatus Poriferisodalis sp. TaxID=3101277 RepID=UPI003B02E06D